MSRIKRYNGSSWVDDPSGFKVRSNGSWNKATVRRYNNGVWETISEEKHTRTWTASWTRSFDQGSNAKPAARDLGRLYQGHYGAPDSTWDGDPWKRQRSMMGFPADMASELLNSKIEKIELYLEIEWAWYWAGAIACIGLHNVTSRPSRFSQVRYGAKEVRYNARKQGMWITFDKSVADAFEKGSVKGFTLLKESDNEIYYGYWVGTDGPTASRPKVRVTYYK